MGRSRTTERAPVKENDLGRQARARAWSYVFECYERKKAGTGELCRAGEEVKRADDAARPDSAPR